MAKRKNALCHQQEDIPLYEVQISPRLHPANVATVGRYADAQSAIEVSRTEQSRRPDCAAYVFVWVTPSTRLLIHHTL